MQFDTLTFSFRYHPGLLTELGLTINKRQSNKIAAKSLSDLDFADHIVLMSDTIKGPRLVLRVEKECKGVNLLLN